MSRDKNRRLDFDATLLGFIYSGPLCNVHEQADPRSQFVLLPEQVDDAGRMTRTLPSLNVAKGAYLSGLPVQWQGFFPLEEHLPRTTWLGPLYMTERKKILLYFVHVKDIANSLNPDIRLWVPVRDLPKIPLAHPDLLPGEMENLVLYGLSLIQTPYLSVSYQLLSTDQALAAQLKSRFAINQKPPATFDITRTRESDTEYLVLYTDHGVVIWQRLPDDYLARRR